MSLHQTRPVTRRAGILVVGFALASVSGANFTADGHAVTGKSGSIGITPRRIVVRPGESTHLQLTGNTPAAWGLRESASQAPPPTFPLKVSANGRYLVDQRGRPWRVQADAAWLMSSEATPAEVDPTSPRGSAQGFNSFYLMAMVHPGDTRPPQRPQRPPWRSAVRDTRRLLHGRCVARRLERYWSWIDSIIAQGGRPAHGRHAGVHVPRVRGRRSRVVPGHPCPTESGRPVRVGCVARKSVQGRRRT